MTSTLRTALVDAFWSHPHTHTMATAAMKAANAKDEDYRTVCGIIDRHLAGRGSVDFGPLVDELTEVLGYKEPEAPKAVPLCEAIVAGVSKLRFKGSRPRRWLPIEEVESEIRKHFAGLSVEEMERVIKETDGGVSELALAVMRLLRKE